MTAMHDTDATAHHLDLGDTGEVDGDDEVILIWCETHCCYEWHWCAELLDALCCRSHKLHARHPTTTRRTRRRR